MLTLAIAYSFKCEMLISMSIVFFSSFSTFLSIEIKPSFGLPFESFVISIFFQDREYLSLKSPDTALKAAFFVCKYSMCEIFSKFFYGLFYSFDLYYIYSNFYLHLFFSLFPMNILGYLKYLNMPIIFISNNAINIATISLFVFAVFSMFEFLYNTSYFAFT